MLSCLIPFHIGQKSTANISYSFRTREETSLSYTQVPFKNDKERKVLCFICSWYMYLFLKIYELYFHYNTVLLSDLLDIYEYKVLKYLQIC